ncbi:hypothetical protein [Halobacteriovorax sp. ZH4_bin.1]|uniref:hypothetical protein n=1 Tax=unclassified Halobacteriovorax TaxID=2639665 RepID=UPI00371DA557
MFKKIIFTSILILSIGLGYWLFTNEKSGPKLSNEEIIEIVKTLKFEWENAHLDKEGMCKKLSYVDDQYYQCFPEYMACLLEKKLVNVHINKKLVPITMKGSYRYHQMPSYRYYDFTVKAEGFNEELKLSFVDSCQEVYVPQRYYPFLANKRDVTISWDNFNRNIFVDKYHVQNWEVLNWAKASKHKLAQQAANKIKERNKYTYAYGLSIDEMEAYCSFQGKSILSARVFDAISIHPEDLNDTTTKYLRAPFYPWERKNTKTLLNEIQRMKDFHIDEITNEERLKLCEKDYSSECLDLNYIQKDSRNVSWAGVYEVFGGPLEYLRNIIHPSENIKLASFYFSWHQKAHQTGMRGYWDGEGFGLNNIAFDPFISKEIGPEYKIAFRCMRTL